MTARAAQRGKEFGPLLGERRVEFHSSSLGSGLSVLVRTELGIGDGACPWFAK